LETNLAPYNGALRPASSDSSAVSNGLRRGIRILTVVPRPTSLPTSSRKERPNNPCSRLRNRDSAWTRGRTAKKTRSTSVAGTPCPSSLMLISNQSPIRRATTRRRHPAFGEDCSPCRTAFSTSGWSEKGGTRASDNPGSMVSSTFNRLPSCSDSMSCAYPVVSACPTLTAIYCASSGAQANTDKQELASSRKPVKKGTPFLACQFVSLPRMACFISTVTSKCSGIMVISNLF